MTYRLLVAEGFEKIPVESVIQNGSVRAQANFLAMSFRHRPAAMEVHLRKQLSQSPHEIVRFLAAMGVGLYDGSPENVEQVAAAFASEANTIIKAMIQRVASNWLSTASSAELANLLRSVAEMEITLRAEDAGRVMLQHTSSPRDAERALFAFRRAMMQGDQPVDCGGRGDPEPRDLRHAPSTSYIFTTASRARIRKFEMLTGLFSGSRHCGTFRPIDAHGGPRLRSQLERETPSFR